MIRILIIDDSAEIRNKIAETIQRSISAENMHRFSASSQSSTHEQYSSQHSAIASSDPSSLNTLPIQYTSSTRFSRLPTISLRGCACNEALTVKEAEIVIISPELSRAEGANLKLLRNAIPNAMMAAIVRDDDFVLIDTLLHQGIDEILELNITITSVFKLIFKLQQRTNQPSSGKLILVDSPKGGVGVTTITAAMGDFLSGERKRVALVDLDHQTQDLSRFLGITPILNDNLSLLLNGNKPLLSEFINDCCTPLWHSSSIITPPPSEALHSSIAQRRFPEIIDRLTDLYEYVIVDCAAHDLAALRPLYQRADQILLTVSADHSLFHATLEKIRRLAQEPHLKAGISLIENNYTVPSISSRFFRAELSRYSFTKHCNWCPDPIPFSPSARCWPGTKQTFLAFLSPKKATKVFRCIAQTLGLPLNDLDLNLSSKYRQPQDKREQATQMDQSFFHSSQKDRRGTPTYEYFSNKLRSHLNKSGLVKQCKQLATKLPKLLDYKEGHTPPERQLPLPAPLITGAVLVRKGAT